MISFFNKMTDLMIKDNCIDIIDLRCVKAFDLVTHNILIKNVES